MKRIGIVLTLVVTFGLWGDTTASLEVVDGRTAPLFDDLGSYHHPISTSTKLAQRYFDQGLTLAYAFNHAEAIRSFREAVSLNPDYLLGYIGLGLAYRHAGQDDRAAGEFRKVVSLKPQSREADRARLLLKGEVRLDAQ